MVSGIPRLLAVLAALLPLVVSAAESTAPTEYELKAIFLYNFTKYVEWPAGPEGSRELSLCVLGTDPFGETLDRILRGESVRGRPLVARRIGSVTEASGCHLLFISPSETERLGEVLRELAGRSILTVGESDGFTRRGGIIRLREEGNRVRFVINIRAAQDAGLRISSQLLKLGEVVGDGER